jgi:protein-S-isoprenylcysteine O-methyltransferase Ste14
MLFQISVTVYQILFFITFIYRNRKIKKQTGLKTVNRSLTVILSTIGSTGIFSLSLISLFFEDFYQLLIPVTVLNHFGFKITGIFLIYSGLVVGFISAASLKNSWRVGVLKTQSTELITSGIYGLSRNPYFMSYFISFLGLFFLSPSLVLALITLVTIVLFHIQVLMEEKHLKQKHGRDYLEYLKKVPRYIFV